MAHLAVWSMEFLGLQTYICIVSVRIGSHTDLPTFYQPTLTKSRFGFNLLGVRAPFLSDVRACLGSCRYSVDTDHGVCVVFSATIDMHP